MAEELACPRAILAQALGSRAALAPSPLAAEAPAEDTCLQCDAVLSLAWRWKCVTCSLKEGTDCIVCNACCDTAKVVSDYTHRDPDGQAHEWAEVVAGPGTAAPALAAATAPGPAAAEAEAAAEADAEMKTI